MFSQTPYQTPPLFSPSPRSPPATAAAAHLQSRQTQTGSIFSGKGDFPHSVGGSTVSWVPQSAGLPPSAGPYSAGPTMQAHRTSGKGDSDSVVFNGGARQTLQSTASWKPVHIDFRQPRTSLAKGDYWGENSTLSPGVVPVRARTSWVSEDPFRDSTMTLLDSPRANLQSRRSHTYPNTPGIFDRELDLSLSPLPQPHTGRNSFTQDIETGRPILEALKSPSVFEPRPMSQWHGEGVKAVRNVREASGRGLKTSGGESNFQPISHIRTLNSVTHHSAPRSAPPTTHSSTLPTPPAPVVSSPRKASSKHTYGTYRPFINCLVSLISVILIFICRSTTRHSLSVLVTAPSSAFRLKPPDAMTEEVRFGLMGWCPSGVKSNLPCVDYVGVDFQNEAKQFFTSDPLFRMTDSVFCALAPAALLLTLFIWVTTILRTLLLRRLGLPISFFSSRRPARAEGELIRLAEENKMMELFWSWWGHERSGVAGVFAVVTAVLAIIAAAMVLNIKSLVSSTGSYGMGAFVPLMVFILNLDLTYQGLRYLVNVRKNFVAFSAGPKYDPTWPKLVLTTSPTVPSGQKPKASPNPSSGQHSRRTVGDGSIEEIDSNREKRGVSKWFGKDKSLREGRRRSSGTSFFIPFRRPTITSQVLEQPPVQPPSVAAAKIPSPVNDGPEDFSTAYQEIDNTIRKSMEITLDLGALLNRQSTDGTPPAPMTASRPTFSQYSVAKRLSTIEDVTEDSKSSKRHSVISRASSASHNRWLEGYRSSPSLAAIMSILRSNQPHEPFVLSEDGLLYIYVEDQRDMEVPRLVPPEGAVRKELIEDALAELAVTKKREGSVEEILENLSSTYFWNEMSTDVVQFMRNGRR